MNSIADVAGSWSLAITLLEVFVRVDDPAISTPPPMDPPPAPSTRPSSVMFGFVERVGTCPETKAASFSSATLISSASEVQIQSFSTTPITLDPKSLLKRNSQRFPAVATIAGGELLKRFQPSRLRKSTPIALNWKLGVSSVASCAAGGPPFIARYFCRARLKRPTRISLNFAMRHLVRQDWR